MTSENHKALEGYLKVVDLSEAQNIMLDIKNISSDNIDRAHQELQKEFKRKKDKYSKK